jgi:hypothetical protein
VPRHALAFISIVGLVALLAAVTGCGSSGNGKTLSSKEYADAVTSICTANAAELRRLVLSSGSKFLTTTKGDVFIAMTNTSLTKLKRLHPPPELEAKAHRLIVEAEAARDQLVDTVKRARKHPGSVTLGNTALLTARRRTIDSANALGANC